jgi:hypothetical protein
MDGARIGNAVGSGIGLLALLLGALWNAHLTRMRDDKMRKQRAQSIAAALGAEIGGYASSLFVAFSSLAAWLDSGVAVKRERLLVALPVVWPKLAEQIGELPPEDARDIAITWQEFEMLRRDLEHYADTAPTAEHAAQKLSEAMEITERAQLLSSRLTGLPPNLIPR